jgi:hypothetical protein
VRGWPAQPPPLTVPVPEPDPDPPLWDPEPPLCDPDPLGLLVPDPDGGVAPPLLGPVDGGDAAGLVTVGVDGGVTVGAVATVLTCAGATGVTGAVAGALAVTGGRATRRFLTFNAGAAWTGARAETLTGLTLVPTAGVASTACGLALCVARALVTAYPAANITTAATAASHTTRGTAGRRRSTRPGRVRTSTTVSVTTERTVTVARTPLRRRCREPWIIARKTSPHPRAT